VERGSRRAGEKPSTRESPSVSGRTSQKQPLGDGPDEHQAHLARGEPSRVRGPKRVTGPAAGGARALRLGGVGCLPLYACTAAGVADAEVCSAPPPPAAVRSRAPPVAPRPRSSPAMASAVAASTATRFLPRLPDPWWTRRARAALPPPPLTWRPLPFTVSAASSRPGEAEGGRRGRMRRRRARRAEQEEGVSLSSGEYDARLHPTAV
jgi:hypothetical protein